MRVTKTEELLVIDGEWKWGIMVTTSRGARSLQMERLYNTRAEARDNLKGFNGFPKAQVVKIRVGYMAFGRVERMKE
jgi:hypothetical protein